MTKYLLAAGCSYTDANWKSNLELDYDCSFKKWPELLGNKLDLPVVNLGKSGIDNSMIFNNALKKIVEDHENIRLVCIGWTESLRFNLYHKIYCNFLEAVSPKMSLSVLNTQKKQKSIEAAFPFYKWIFERTMDNQPPENSKNLINTAVRDWLDMIHMLTLICEKYEIPIIHAPMISTINRNHFHDFESKMGIQTKWDLTGAAKMIYNLMMDDYNHLDTDKIIGWPVSELLDGFDVSTLIRKDIDKYAVSNLDTHPSALGHEKIAELYYEKYKEIYV